MKIWLIKYICYLYNLLTENKESIDWNTLSLNKTVPLFIFYKFIDKINFEHLTRHPEVNLDFIDKFKTQNLDWDFINFKNSELIDVSYDFESKLDYYQYYDDLSKNTLNLFETTNFLDFQKEFKLEYYVKLIQKNWRKKLMNPHTDIGKRYLSNYFQKIRLKTSF